MRIGPLKLVNNLFLAPMAGVTDRPFRQLCRRFGAGLAVSEMISADTSLWGSRKTLRRLDHEGEQPPVAVQIVGADPRRMAEAARRNVDHGAQLLDINMGCPAKKVCKAAAGSALLRDEALVARILEAVVTAVAVPVTLKIRTGWDPQQRNAVAIARIAEQAGIAAVAVHGRTRSCGYQGAAEYHSIRAVKQAVSLPVIANGDIASAEKARAVLEYTGADALMIGRAARGRPWIFRDIAHYLATGEHMPEPDPGWVRDLLLEHLGELYAFYGREHGVRVARKHIAWYSQTRPDGAAFRQRVNQVRTTQEQGRLIHQYFDGLPTREGLAA